MITFRIDGSAWTLDLREGKGTLAKGEPDQKPALIVICSGNNFVLLVMGKLNPQQVLLLLTIIIPTGTKRLILPSAHAGID